MIDLSSDFLDRNTLFLLLILPKLGGITLARTRRTVVSQQKLIKTVRNFGSLCVKYSRETDTVNDIENYVFQATTEDFQYFNCHEVEDIIVVDGKDAKGLPVDVSTVVIKRCRKLLMIACVTSYYLCIASRQFLEELSDLPVMVVLASDFFDRSTQIFR